ncbi:hypothetical protein D3C72_1500870 [compost metagenome]
MASKVGVTASTSKVTGSAPVKPNKMATSVPCPLPVLASEPYNNIFIPSTVSIGWFCASEAVNCCAALHGPKVCELDGPMPILKISKTEICSLIITKVSYAKL